MKYITLISIQLLGTLGVGSCDQPHRKNRVEGSGPIVLKPLAADATQPARLRRLIYVPVYSSIYWGFDQQTINLSATLSIRNVSTKHSLAVHSVKYYDSEGREIREYVPKPSSLAPMATADFVIQRHDTAGGPGANFLVDWSSLVDLDEPVIEAVMIGQHGNAGISFTSAGRPLPKASEELSRPPVPK